MPNNAPPLQILADDPPTIGRHTHHDIIFVLPNLPRIQPTAFISVFYNHFYHLILQKRTRPRMNTPQPILCAYKPTLPMWGNIPFCIFPRLLESLFYRFRLAFCRNSEVLLFAPIIRTTKRPFCHFTPPPLYFRATPRPHGASRTAEDNHAEILPKCCMFYVKVLQTRPMSRSHAAKSTKRAPRHHCHHKQYHAKLCTSYRRAHRLYLYKHNRLNRIEHV